MDRTIDPQTMRYEVAGRIYRIGTRVLTPGGEGEVVAFAPGNWNDIGIRLDGDDETIWTEWRYADLLDDEPLRSNDAEDRYNRGGW